MNEQEVEDEVRNKGLSAPRVTPGDVDDAIRKAEYYVFPDSLLTICCLTLKNGFNITGTSACASPDNFNKELGEKIAYDKARDQIWAFEGYLLKEKLAILLTTDILG